MSVFERFKNRKLNPNFIIKVPFPSTDPKLELQVERFAQWEYNAASVQARKYLADQGYKVPEKDSGVEYVKDYASASILAGYICMTDILQRHTKGWKILDESLKTSDAAQSLEHSPVNQKIFFEELTIHERIDLALSFEKALAEAEAEAGNAGLPKTSDTPSA